MHALIPCLIGALAICVAVAVILFVESWTPGRVAAVSGLGVFVALAILWTSDPPRFRWAGTIVTTLLWVGIAVFIVADTVARGVTIHAVAGATALVVWAIQIGMQFASRKQAG